MFAFSVSPQLAAPGCPLLFFRLSLLYSVALSYLHRSSLKLELEVDIVSSKKRLDNRIMQTAN